MSADLVLHHGKIYTVDESRPRASALAVRNGRFVAVGNSEELIDAYPDAEHIDARGQTVIPGLIDSHAHLLATGLSLRRVDLNRTASPGEIVDRLQAFVAEHELAPDAWLRGHGWDQNEWSTSDPPSRTQLDTAFPNRPVWLTRTDVHAGWANTAALEAAIGLDELRRMDDPDGGKIRRSDTGAPTGILVDAAMSIVEEQIPPPSDIELDRALSAALEHTAKHGITSLHDAGTDLEGIRRFRRFIEDGSFPLRVYAMIDGRGETFDYFSDRGPVHHPSGRLDVASVKYFADGALGSRGAALLEPYADAPEQSGFLLTEPDAFQKNVRVAANAGFQVNTHAIGDRANRMVLDAYAQVRKHASASLVRPRIEHAQIVAPADRPRFRALGVTACVQPLFATSDMNWASDRLGPDRVGASYAWQSLEAAGARLAFSSDAPVESIDPIRGFHAAVTRENDQGNPPGGWRPEECVSRRTALRAYTLGGAYASFQEDELGSITPGKRADFVVLSADILERPASALLDAEVVTTYLSGTPIYARPDWPEA